jgi:hypothetical protein
MTYPPKVWPASSPGCAPVELLLSGSRRLALLLAAHALALPVLLFASGLRNSVWVALAAMLLAAAAAPDWARLCLCRGPRAPRRLRFTPEGQLWLDLAGGYSETVALADRSLIAGPWRLLVLEGSRGRHRVLIDAGEVDPAALAALGRCLGRLAAGPAGGRRALRSAITGQFEPGRPGS